VASSFARPERIPAEVARAMITDWIDAPGYDDANREMRSARIEDLHEITVPVTIAWGEHDTLVGPPKPERRPPGAELVILRGCGHVPTWDDPEQVARVIRATVARA
jgi:pimeloyl-ACP methyl ester carboxylesterase